MQRECSFRGSLRKAAFTLIELLVVVAIMAILASLLLPALSRAKKAAHGAGCRSNLRQFTLAMSLFVTDHGHFPGFGVTLASNDDPALQGWRVALEPYGLKRLPGKSLPAAAVTGYYPVVGNTERGVWRCPAAWFPEHDVGSSRANYDYNADGIVTSSGWLGLGRTMRLDAAGRPLEVVVVKEPEVVAPSEMIAFGDAAFRVTPTRLDFGWTPLGRASDSGVNGAPIEVRDANRIAKERHSGFWNLGFVDGHVQALKLQRVFFDESDSARELWNRDHQSHRKTP